MAPPDDTPRNDDESSSDSAMNSVVDDDDRKKIDEAEEAPAKVSSNSNSSSSSSLFERLGGTSAVRSVVDDFYTRCLDDPLLSHFFDASRLSALKHHQLRFLKLAFTSIPDDLDVAALLLDKHRRLFEENGLDGSHFDRVCLHLVASLDAAGAHPDLIQEAAQIVLPLRSVFEKGAQMYGGKGGDPPIDGEPEEEEDGAAVTPEIEEPDVTSPSSSQGQKRYGSHAVLHSMTSSTATTTPQDRPATLSDRLGGNDALRAAVAGLYQRILEDPELAVFFQNVNMTALKLHQIEFLKVAFGQIPDGLDVAGLIMDKHASLFEAGLNESHFDRVAHHLAATLVDLNVPETLIDEAMAIVGPLRAVFEMGAQRASQ